MDKGAGTQAPNVYDPGNTPDASLASLAPISEADASTQVNPWLYKYPGIINVEATASNSIIVQPTPKSNTFSSNDGVGTMNALFGKVDSNVIYTKNNEDITVLLANRLQLPAALDDDILAKHSVAQSTPESNSDFKTNAANNS